MRNLKIKFFVCGESIAAENPKLAKKVNKMYDKGSVPVRTEDEDEGKRIISALLHSL